MRAELLYIITFGSDTESTRVAAGLYQKYAVRAGNAAVVNAGEEETYTLANMKCGEIPLNEGIADRANTNFKAAWKAVGGNKQTAAVPAAAGAVDSALK